MEKLNVFESVQPCSGQYSFKQDLRLNAWYLVACVTYLVVLKLLGVFPEWSPLTRALVNLSPLLPVALYVRDWIRFVRGLDELQRRVQAEAWLFAAIGTLLVVTIFHILADHELLSGKLQHGMTMGGTFALMFVLWLVGSVSRNRRYR